MLQLPAAVLASSDACLIKHCGGNVGVCAPSAGQPVGEGVLGRRKVSQQVVPCRLVPFAPTGKAALLSSQVWNYSHDLATITDLGL